MGEKLVTGVFGQKVSEQFTTANGLPGDKIQCLCRDIKGRIWVGTDRGLAVRSGNRWRAIVAKDGLEAADIRALEPGPDGVVFAATPTGLAVYRERKGWTAKDIPIPEVDGGPRFLAVGAHGGVRLGTSRRIFALAPGAETLDPVDFPVPLKEPCNINSIRFGPQGTLWVSTSEGLVRLMDGDWTLFDGDNPDTGLVYYNVIDAREDSRGFVYVGSVFGLYIFDGRDNWFPIIGNRGLPVETVPRLDLAGDGSLWLGTPKGAVLFRGGKWEYFAGRRWLPDDMVTAVLALPGGEAWIGTPSGLAFLRRVPMTLEQKSEKFEQMMDKYFKRLGFTTELHLKRPGDLNGYIREATDNDGLWTSIYLAAECFRFAVTGGAKARANARETMEAMLDLERKSSIEGFPARALVKKGEKGVVKSDADSGNWHPSLDGEWEWKGDTSSDELVGHFFAYPIYFDLLATRGEKKEIAAVTRRITDHLINHDFTLVDVTGRHTTWAVFSPRLLNNNSWQWQRGLNSLEMLAIIKAACHIVGDPRYDSVYHDLVLRHRFAINAIEQKLIIPGLVNNSDDELAFLSYYPLMSLERDPDILALYRMSLERSWRIERAERNPLWNVIFGALTGEPCDIEAAARSLREYPLDPIRWTMTNSHRKDLEYSGQVLGPRSFESRDVIPYDERSLERWNSNPFRLDGGHKGMRSLDPSPYLLPYWMARFHGLLAEAGE